ncbi:MAG: peptidase C39 family protein, partial [Aquificaceae bacterium]|nr:peptidase C39 family protein [Aquificaceae bacterium]
VLSFYGIEVPQETIAEKVYHPKLKGALITDLENYAKEKGLRAETRRGELSDLRSLIDRGIPPILLLETGRFGTSNPHYVVVVGYRERSFLLHTGYERAKVVGERELDRMWEKMGRVMLLVYPP